jgi:hypothetical protein
VKGASDVTSDESLTKSVKLTEDIFMSEEPTKDMPGQPTLAEVMEAVNAIGIELHSFHTSMEIRLDRIESFAHKTHSEMLSVRADVKEPGAEFEEFRSRFKQPA